MSLFYPDPELADSTVRIRKWSENDLDCVEQASTDPAILESTTVPPVFSHDEGIAFVHRQWGRWINGDGLSLAICDPETNEAQGLVALLRRRQTGVFGAGYWVVPAARRRGLAGHALKLISTWALREGAAGRIEGLAHMANIGSQRTMRSAGFQREGVLRQLLPGTYGRQDAVIFSLVSADLK